MADICAVVCDLIFSAKIKGTADALGADLMLGQTADQISHHVDENTNLVIVDLNLESDDPFTVIRQVKARQLHAKVLCYVAHVNTELIHAAEAAGADEIMPRSRFATVLPDVLRNPAARP